MPFDLPEAEQELAGGYNVEYSSIKFALFFMGEYANMILASAMMVTLFFGGWTLPWFGSGPAGGGLAAWHRATSRFFWRRCSRSCCCSSGCAGYGRGSGMTS